MTKTGSSSSRCKRRSRKVVEVVSCPSPFPDFGVFGSDRASGVNKRRRTDRTSASDKRGEKDVWERSAASVVDCAGGQKIRDLDFDKTAREIHALGSTAFTGKQAKQHAKEQYKALTGREMKSHKVPLKIVRGIRKKAAKREARAAQEARESGVVTHAGAPGGSKQKKEDGRGKGYSEEKRRTCRMHGPAPDVGYMKGGVLRVHMERRGGGGWRR